MKKNKTADWQRRLAQQKKERTMDLKEWRAAQLHELTLPSGLDVKVKDVGMMDLALNGDIPDPLMGMVDELTNGDSLEIGMEDFVKFGDLVNLIVRTCIVEPPVADEPSDTHLGVKEINARDRMELFNWANREADSLVSFRSEESESMEAA